MNNYQEITVQEAKKLIDSNEAVIIDVREQDEYDEIHISEATLHCLSEFNPNDVKHENKAVIVQCRSGGRSQTACFALINAGLTQDIYNLTGGILAWESAGLPVN